MRVITSLRPIAARRAGDESLAALCAFFHARCGAEPSAELAIEQARRALVPFLDTAERKLVREYLTARIVTRLAVDAGTSPSLLVTALDDAERLHGVSAFRVAVRVLGDPKLLELPLAVLVELGMTVVQATAPAREVTVWRGLDDGALTLLHGGHTGFSDAARDRAREALDETRATRGIADVATFRVWQRQAGAVVWTPLPGSEAPVALLCGRLADLLGLALERSSLIEGRLGRAGAGERLLKRLSLDIHDGPLQDAALLASQLKELRRAVAGHPDHTLLDRVDDLLGLVEFMDGDLRDLAFSLDPPALARRPLEDALQAVVRKFAARCAVETELSVEGGFEELTDSQRIAVVRVIQEALSNVRDHSGAEHVRISVAGDAGAVVARVEDDGRGFDVESALAGAARGGHLGLAGMTERVHLLGGSCGIDSAPGRGTRVHVELLRWEGGEVVELHPTAA